MTNDVVMQMISEREQVFQLNNNIIASFKLPRFAYLTALRRILPPEVTLVLVFALIAAFFAFAAPRIVRYAADTQLLGEHMRPVDHVQAANLHRL